jgi:CubicO group peptidase (beta-lactamase class C family)
MERHSRHADARSLLIASAIATLAYGGAIVGSTRAGATVDAAAVTRQLVAKDAVSDADRAVTTIVKHTAALELGKLGPAEAAVRAQIEAGALPGAALAVGRNDTTLLEKGIGHVGWTASAEKVDAAHTMYDLASLTKVLATTPAVMLLVQDGKMDLDAPVVRYLPEFGGGAREQVTVRMLLTHTSGLPAGTELAGPTPEDAWKQLLRTPLAHAPGTVVEYSDIGMNVLFAAAQRAAGEPLPDLLRRRVYGPLGMTSTVYQPGAGCAACAPTFRDPATDEPVRGVVHDPIARKLGGTAGNAGLFSTAHDVGRYAAMLANGGELDGVRIFSRETVKLFTTRQPDTGTRALGWDTPGPAGSGGFGTHASATSFGHTGFTGTSITIDPARHTWTVLLSNRVYQPHAPNAIMSLRRTLNDRVAVAADDFDVALQGD